MGVWKDVFLADLRLPSPAIRKAILTALVFVACLMFFAPTVLTFWWHLRNGNSIVYKGRTVWVPLEWVAKVDPQGTLLEKLSRTVLSKQPLNGLISFHPSPYLGGGRDEAARTWEAHYWAGAAETDDIVSGPMDFGSSAGEVVCMESRSKRYPERASADCLMLDIKLDASFGGEGRDVDVFLQIIHQMK